MKSHVIKLLALALLTGLISCGDSPKAKKKGTTDPGGIDDGTKEPVMRTLVLNATNTLVKEGGDTAKCEVKHSSLVVTDKDLDASTKEIEEVLPLCENEAVELNLVLIEGKIKVVATDLNSRSALPVAGATTDKVSEETEDEAGADEPKTEALSSDEGGDIIVTKENEEQPAPPVSAIGDTLIVGHTKTLSYTADTEAIKAGKATVQLLVEDVTKASAEIVSAYIEANIAKDAAQAVVDEAGDDVTEEQTKALADAVEALTAADTALKEAIKEEDSDDDKGANTAATDGDDATDTDGDDAATTDDDDATTTDDDDATDTDDDDATNTDDDETPEVEDGGFAEEKGGEGDPNADIEDDKSDDDQGSDKKAG